MAPLPLPSYPTNIKSWDALVNLSSVVVAEDPNTAYAEIVAIETALGTSPTTSATWGASTTLSTSTSWASVAARIQNLENGIYNPYTNYISKTAESGHNTITPVGTSTVSLTFRAQTGQTANQIEIKNASGTVTSSFDKDGYFYTPVIDGGTP